VPRACSAHHAACDVDVASLQAVVALRLGRAALGSSFGGLEWPGRAGSLAKSSAPILAEPSAPLEHRAVRDLPGKSPSV
jgi:hypothetical protein